MTNFFRENEQPFESHGIGLFCLTIRRDAHQVGQVLDKNDPVFQILVEQKIVFVSVFFGNIFRKRSLNLMLILEDIGFLKANWT